MEENIFGACFAVLMMNDAACIFLITVNDNNEALIKHEPQVLPELSVLYKKQNKKGYNSTTTITS